MGAPPLPAGYHADHARALDAGYLDHDLRVAEVGAESLLTNAVLWGRLSDQFLAGINLAWIDDEWCRTVVAAVIVLRDEGQDVTLATVHAMLADAGINRGPDDVWWLAMADVTAADGRLDEDAANVYLEQVRIEHARRTARQALVVAAQRLETAADPAQVLADLAEGVDRDDLQG